MDHIPLLAVGKGWFAVDKPAGLSIHNEPGADLCSILIDHINNTPSFQNQIGYDPNFGLHAVHRLDKQTSGTVLLACRPDILRHFATQFEDRTVKKRYVAILHGKLAPPEKTGGWGIWQWPLSKQAGGRQGPAGKGPRLNCQTRFRVLRYSRHYTLIECEPLTGRKHQIRRHANLAGHFVAGDERYGTRRACNYLKNCGFHRFGLHASSLTLRLPDFEKPVTIQSLKIPAEMQRLLSEDDLES